MSTVLETKPSKNPPLLNEIVYILERKTTRISPDVAKQVERESTLKESDTQVHTIPAICIMNKLRNLKNIANGVYSDSESLKTQSRPSMDNIFYDECVYYLSKYGTHLSLLEFYIKHCDISKALNYIVDNQLSTEIFIDIYMRCLKDGVINVFQEQMSIIDSSLNLWKVST